MENLSNLSRGNLNILTNLTNLTNLAGHIPVSNQFMPNNRHAHMMTNKSVLDNDDDDNFAFHKLKQYPKKNKISSLLLSDETSSAMDHHNMIGLKAIKHASRGPLTNITNNFEQ
jgi:hypothetical protein